MMVRVRFANKTRKRNKERDRKGGGGGGTRIGTRRRWMERGTNERSSIERDTTRGMLFSSNGKDSVRPTRGVTH